jgi:hypothetical protein
MKKLLTLMLFSILSFNVFAWTNGQVFWFTFDNDTTEYMWESAIPIGRCAMYLDETSYSDKYSIEDDFAFRWNYEDAIPQYNLLVTAINSWGYGDRVIQLTTDDEHKKIRLLITKINTTIKKRF